jgi:Lon protease-like protein
MENRVIPIFPLPLVQFPGALTPLHIFEPRYRQMLKDVMDKDKIFGVLYRNDETLPDAEQQPPGSVGCTVEVAVVQGLPDGRSNILCVGGSRYRLLKYVEGAPYLQAEVEFFDDEPTFDDLSTQTSRVKHLFQRVLVASRKLKDESDREANEVPELPDDAQALSFIVTAYLDIEANEKQGLLELTDTRERLREVNEILEKLAKDYELRAVVHQVAKKNGHGGKLPKIE